MLNPAEVLLDEPAPFGDAAASSAAASAGARARLFRIELGSRLVLVVDPQHATSGVGGAHLAHTPDAR